MISIQVQTSILFFIFVVYITMSSGQRPSFAGSRPNSGYKDRFKPNTTETPNDLSNRVEDDLLSNQTQRPPVFVNVVQPDSQYTPLLSDRVDGAIISTSGGLSAPGNSNIGAVQPTITPENSTRLPYDALGDRDLVDRLNRLPPDQRPFWLINAQAIEAHRNRNASLLNQQTQLGSFSSQTLDLNSGTTQLNQAIIGSTTQASISNRISVDSQNLGVALNTAQSEVITQQSSPPQGSISSEAVSGEGLLDLEPTLTSIKPNSAGFPNYGVINS